MSFIRRNWNLGNLIVVLGVVGLVVTLWVPYITAGRVARIERNAEDHARALLAATLDAAEGAWDPQATGAVGDLASRVPQVAAVPPDAGRTGLPAGLYFESKHYLYSVFTRGPDDQIGDDTAAPPAFEVFAWPRSYLGPGRSAFYFPAGGRPAYTRNLKSAYQGFGAPPQPGEGRPREDGLSEPDYGYHDRLDERWLWLERPAPPAASGG
ncbi:MAG: hypothetical protein AAF628_03495 [Planctomycetota bacterium]